MVALSKTGVDAVLGMFSIQNSHRNLVDNLSSEIIVQEKRIRKIDQVSKALYESYVLGRVHEEKFLILDKSFDEEKISLIRNIKKLQQDLDVIEKKTKELSRSAKFFQNFLSSLN